MGLMFHLWLSPCFLLYANIFKWFAEFLAKKLKPTEDISDLNTGG